MRRRLLRIVGRRAALGFGVVTGLVAATLATVGLTSRYALKAYVEDQLRRIPWDVAVYRQDAGGDVAGLADAARRVPGIARVETLAFLRARLAETSPVAIEVDGRPLATPWLSLLAASDLSVLPPEATAALERGRADRPGHASNDLDSRTSSRDRPPRAEAAESSGIARDQGVVLALVGPERAMGAAFLALQGAKEIVLRSTGDAPGGATLALPIGGVVRLDRDQLNRWLLEQTGSVSYIPYIGLILLTAFQPDLLVRFDDLAADVVSTRPPTPETESSEATSGDYLPEVVVLARLDRPQLVSGWDIGGSLGRVVAVNRRLRLAAQLAVLKEHGIAVPPVPTDLAGADDAADLIAGFVVDSTTEVLLTRMDRIARLVGLVALLVALPLVWIGWVLAAHLTTLLMLNERRTLGLMRLRGISGALLGRTLLVAILAGGAVGGIAGLVAGSVGAVLFLERGALPLRVAFEPRQLLLLAGFLVVSVGVALAVGRRLIRYATRISPLEAAGRVTLTEGEEAALGFGPLQGAALLVGLYVLVVRWLTGGFVAPSAGWTLSGWGWRAMDCLGLPLFLYGLATLLAANRRAVERVLAPLVRPVGGPLGRFALEQLAVKPHRTGAFLLIVALLASVSLYPAIAGRSFAEKAHRGARVQLGADWQIVLNAPDLVDPGHLRGALADEVRALDPVLRALVQRIEQVPGVSSATYVLEAVLPHFYLPDYGLKGVPMYLLGDVQGYLARSYWEPEVGLSTSFPNVLAPLADGAVAVSPAVADFWRLEAGTPVLVGLDGRRQTVMRPASGIVAHLPGIPPRSVSDRQGFVEARIDYLNYLFTHQGYLVGAAHDPQLAGLQLLIPRIVLLVRAEPTASAEALGRALRAALPVTPLELHHLADETAKIATDMYIALALANLRIYLAGGLVLALVAVLAIALANYVEERRTLALLRVRGASPAHLWRVGLAMNGAPALVGLVIGLGTALVAGFGLANYVWLVREVRTVVERLPTHLVVPPLVGVLLAGLALAVLALAAAFSAWVFRRTAHERIREG